MDVSKNLNPFLFDEPTSISEASDPAKNPFLVGDVYDSESTPFSAINPFSDNVIDPVNIVDFSDPFSAGVNPFGDIPVSSDNIFSQSTGTTVNPQFDIFGSPVQPVPIDDSLFGNSTVQPVPIDASLFGNSTAQPPRPPRPPSPRDVLYGSSQITDPTISGKPPPPRPPPPSKETKDLLQTVIGAIEATTDTLQDKLITTRTPCPSPAGGQHSRSPTPDIQITAPEKESDSFSAVFGQTIELSDPEIEDVQADTSNRKQPTTENQDNNVDLFGETESKPTESSHNNEIDLFGDTISHSKPRTTQDILNLYNKPKESDRNQIDLLSGDLISDDNVVDENIVDGNSSKCVDLLDSDVIDSRPTPFDMTVNEAQISEDRNEFHSIQTSSASPEQISDKSGSEPTVIETDIYINKEKSDESVMTSDYPAQNYFIPTDNIGEFNEDGFLPTNEYQTTDLPSSIFSTGSTPPETDRSRKQSIDEFSEKVQPRKDSIEATEKVASRRESVEASTEKSSIRKESIEGFTEQIVPRRESIETGTEKPDPRRESIENVAETVTQRRESSDSFNQPTVPRKDSIISSTEQSIHQTDVINNVCDQTSSRRESTEAFSDRIAPVSSDIYTTEVGIVERSNTYVTDAIQKVETKTDISQNIFSVGQVETSSSSTQETIFGDIPSSNIQPPSTGFNIFGDDISNKPIPGSESTGATLFETEAPAPNVGMSLFGAGHEATLDIFAESKSNTMVNPFAPMQPITSQTAVPSLGSQNKKQNQATEEEFDAFSARFDNVPASNLESGETTFDPFTSSNRASSPWGGQAMEKKGDGFGFDDNAQFDSFLALHEPPPPPPRSTPRRTPKQTSADSDEGQMNVVIRPMAADSQFPSSSPVPVLAPPPIVSQSAFTDSTPRFNPFDRNDVLPGVPTIGDNERTAFERSDSQETPPTPLFEEDQSVPLEQYPRTAHDGRIWEMYLRQPNKKKITGQRFWKKTFLKMTDDGSLELYNNKDDKEPFHSVPLQPCYSVSDIGAQQFDQFGKIFTVKVQYIFYKERPGVRPGQISKAERITTKLSKFAQYAIAGDYEGVKEFASDVRKLGMPVEHAPQISQLLKLGTQNYEELKLFASLVEENMFKLVSSRERALSYKSEEVQLTAVDETFVEQDLRGAVIQMVARVRIFFLGFLSGMTEVDLGINDLRKQGHEVVGRHDIIPVITEEWIRLEDIEFHCTVDKEEFEKTRHIRFRPPDACYIELMRYRVRPPKNRELPLQVKTKFILQGKQIEIQCEILVPGFSGRKLGQVPCEDVAVRFPLPECWIYMFRVEKHFRYGSVKSAHRRTGKVKGIERFKGTVESAESALMEVTSGQAKYEHQHKAIVWRMSRLPKEGQGAYSVHQFTCKMHLTSYDQIPESFDKHCMIEFTMPATTVSHCVMRSVSVSSDDPPEKYVRYLARHEYKVEIEFSSGSGPSDYIAATKLEPDRSEERKIEPVGEESSSDESS